METIIISQLSDYYTSYKIMKEDEIGLIPKEAHMAIVFYDELSGKPELVRFHPEIKHPGLSEDERKNYEKLCRRYDRQHRKAIRRMNKPRKTLEDVRKIAVRLESSLVD